jgi:CYTH domain-containing protein
MQSLFLRFEMGNEIERKFLVIGIAYKDGSSGIFHRQGYLSTAKDRTVRVRTAAGKGFITIKGKMLGVSRPEYEYEIPLRDAEEMLVTLCEGSIIEKMRYRIAYSGSIWEVDEFLGDNAGLVVAEVELEEENQLIKFPSWVGKEVSHDVRYLNSNLTRNPYTNWKA